MKARTLLKKYTKEWTAIEAAVWDDMVSAFGKCDEKDEGNKRRRIAYNAAFEATYMLHRVLKKKKAGVV